MPAPQVILPGALRWRCRALGIRPTPHVLLVWAGSQQMDWLMRDPSARVEDGALPAYQLYRRMRISTSRYGLGQRAGSNRTPLGLHAVAVKAGAGWPVGTVFEGRRPVGWTWAGAWPGPIAHRILWLRGLEPGFNQGADVDSFHRYIYVHGLGDEPTLGRPASRGCIHLSSSDLMPLFDRIPEGTLVWIDAGRPPRLFAASR